ncbi:hypothetical protein [Galbitalea soli]|uniref:Uncharacterized protein n=1 Tax=Galbitalea soli TaxID=1268042 RepID=A0A7C9PLY1_9MICO|nr:hypothetical protein [Galbitalea soli]NEM90389.1 hypothetical protein [Galbitalea soli]NYJ31099.1 hypothetical protein [Galbitalea soli]
MTIEWGNFLIVLVASILAGCGTVILFALGLRFAGPDTRRLRPLGVVCFALCAALILYGVYLVIPFFHR